MKYSLRSLMTFSIRDLLWLLVVVALALGWWIDRSRKPETYYVHLFATHFSLDLEKRDPMHPEYGAPVHLTTISIQSGTPFHIAIPHEYNPSIEMEGVLTVSDELCVGKMMVMLTAPDLAMVDESITPLTVDKVHALQDPRFSLVVSRLPNAQAPAPNPPKDNRP
jgi:hypothetical protein